MSAEKHRSIADGSAMPPDSLDVYLEEIDATPLLSPEEEAQVARRAQAGDEEAMHRLVCSNLRFVVSVAKKYQNRGMDLDDLIAEGNVGLLTAARKLDPGQGVKFISYAVWWIRQAILKALAEQSHSVRIPLNRATDLATLRRASSLLLQHLEREPTEEELAEESGLSVDIVRGLHGLSLADERTDDDTEDGTQAYQLADPGSDPAQQLLETEHGELLARALHRLPPRLGAVLRLRYGLNGSQEHTLEKLGRALGVSRARAGQLSEKALALLRADCELATAAGREPVAVPPRKRATARRQRSGVGRLTLSMSCVPAGPVEAELL